MTSSSPAKIEPVLANAELKESIAGRLVSGSIPLGKTHLIRLRLFAAGN